MDVTWNLFHVRYLGLNLELDESFLFELRNICDITFVIAIQREKIHVQLEIKIWISHLRQISSTDY